MIRFRRERQDRSELKSKVQGTPATSQTRASLRPSVLDLVHQAASAVQLMKDEANEAMVRATDVARRATELLSFAEDRITAAELAHCTAENQLQGATARVEDLEQAAVRADAQISFLGQQLCAAEQRAKDAEHQAWTADQRAADAEQRAIEAEDALSVVEEAIRREFSLRGSQTTLAA